jgi:RNA polymerase sigma-70 factor (sigma-E family)
VRRAACGRPAAGRFRLIDEATCWHPHRIVTSVGTCEEFIAGQQRALLRAAYLLTGSSASAQDLVQETLVRVLLHWRRVERADAPEAYVRRIMLHLFLGGQRRAWTGEVPQAELPDTATPSAYDKVDERDQLRRALLQMPARQRAAVVLRHYEDLSEADTAALMRCSVGNVKALTSRGLAVLRAAMTAPADDPAVDPAVGRTS